MTRIFLSGEPHFFFFFSKNAYFSIYKSKKCINKTETKNTETSGAWYRSSLVTFYDKKWGFVYTICQLLINTGHSHCGEVAIRYCREVKIRVNVWTVCQDPKKVAVVERWPIVEV